jgi:hypothetical protein
MSEPMDNDPRRNAHYGWAIAVKLENANPYSITDDPPAPAPPKPLEIGDKVAIPHSSKWIGPFEVLAVYGKYFECETGAGLTVIENRWSQEWRYADDPVVVYVTKLEIQISTVRIRQRAYASQVVGFKDDAPACETCGVWPCLELEACPDYLGLAIGMSAAANQRAKVRRTS